MKQFLLAISLIFIIFHSCFSQVNEKAETPVLFHGLVIDASSFAPVPNTQIMINRAFSAVSTEKGSFALYVNRNDTVVFKSLGFKPATMYVRDTLRGNEFVAGVFLHSDTLLIDEVIIVPRIPNLRYEILNAKSKSPSTMDNARYNVAVSAYQGKNSQGVLGDPDNNYAVLSQKQKIKAFERGGIPSDMIVGISPFLLVPAGYLLIQSLQGKPDYAPSVTPNISDREIENLHKKYLERLNPPPTDKPD